MTAHLNLYRRHGKDCTAQRPKGSTSSESDEHKRGAKRCSCLIHASGTLGGIFLRQSTSARHWDAARAAIAPLLGADSWTPHLPAPPSPPSPTTPVPTPARKPLLSLKDAITQYLAQHEAESTADGTLQKYRQYLVGRLDGKPSKNATLLQFATDKGFRYLQQLDGKTDVIRELMQSWKTVPKASTKNNRLDALKSFFQFFVDDPYLAVNPARIKRRRNLAHRTGGKTPPYLMVPEEDEQGNEIYPDTGERISFSDDDIRRMLEACRNYGKRQPTQTRQVVAINEYTGHHRRWKGEDLAAFIELSYCTGLRIIDVACFHASRLRPDGTLRVRATKNKKWISVHVDEDIQAMIRDRARRFGPWIFGDPRGRKPASITQAWRRPLETLWASMGPWEHRPIHHRFRHTFVRVLYQNNTPTSVIAALIGDDEQTVRDHYSNYSIEYQQTFTSATRKAMQNRPRFSYAAS